MNSFIVWVGGKSRLAGTIVKMFPPHRTYVEVFGGAGWVLFKKEPSKCEVYNDRYDDLVNLFRVVKYSPAEFTETLNLILFSRKTYYEFSGRLKGRDWHNEMERSAAFYITLKQSFGGQPGHGWGLSRARGAKTLIDYDLIQAVAKRLERVYIENRDFEAIIKLYDSPETLFYLDPPYWSTEALYRVKFTTDDHNRSISLETDKG